MGWFLFAWNRLTHVRRRQKGLVFTRPRLEWLEDRVAPAANFWQGTAGGSWSVAANWSLGHTPIASDTLTFDTVAPHTNTNSVDNIANLTVAGVNFTGGFSGQIDLSGNNLTVTDLTGTSGTITSSSGTPTLRVGPTGSDTFGGVLAGKLSLTKAGTGTLTLSANNTYTGTTTINGGTLELQSAGVYTYSGGTIFINNGSTLLVSGKRYDFNSDTFVFDSNGGGTINVTATGLGGLQLLGATQIQSNGGARNTISGVLNTSPSSRFVVTMNVAPGTDPTTDLEVSANIFNAGSFLKTGAGTLTLSGTNTYTGTTTIDAGTLIVNGSDASSPVSLTAGSFQGTGTVKSNAATGGAINPGTAGTIGTLSTATGAFSSTLNGSTYQIDLSGPAAADQLLIGNGATINLAGGTLNVNVLGSAVGDSYTIISSPSHGIRGTFNGLTNNATFAAGGRTFRIKYTAAAVTLTDVATPTVVTTPNLLAITLGTTPSTLNDTADLAGGYNPTGTITFQLFRQGVATPVDTETVTVKGNGTYTTPTGFTLPSSGTVTGTYQWNATYSGNSNNNPASDVGASNERVTVSPASPALVTTASPDVALPAGPPGTVTLSDSALLSGGYHPTGTIAFTLSGPNGFSYTQTDTVRGNGPYNASATLPTTGTVAGTYTWAAHYSGDANNTAADDQGGTAEQTLVNPASPTLVATASPAIEEPTVGLTLTDTAVLSGGYHPTGTIDFRLTGPGGFVYTQTDTVSGSGTYTASTTLPATAAPGTYTWTAHYNGDDNNAAANDQGGTAEQVTIDPNSPTLETTAIPSTGNLGVRLQDTATLAGGFNPTGSITFRLYAPGVNPISPAATATYTETVNGVNGDGTYHTTVGFVSNATGIWHWVATYNGNPNNNLASNDPLDEPVTIAPVADIALTKTVQPSQVMFGENVTFTLIVHNKGPDAATDVFVDDPLPPGLAFVSATPSQGTFVSASGIWIVGTLANGATATLRLTDRVAAFGPIVNRAEAGADQFDPDLSNNVAAAAVTGTNPAPIISKRSFLASTDPSPAPPAVGGPARPLPALDALRVDIVFINDLYEDVLGREAKPAELAFWINQLLLGVPRSAVARRV